MKCRKVLNPETLDNQRLHRLTYFTFNSAYLLTQFILPLSIIISLDRSTPGIKPPTNLDPRSASLSRNPNQWQLTLPVELEPDFLAAVAHHVQQSPQRRGNLSPNSSNNGASAIASYFPPSPYRHYQQAKRFR